MAHVTLLNFDAGCLLGDDKPLVAGDAPCGKKLVQNRWVATFDDTDEEAAYTPSVQMPGQYAGGTLMATLTVMFESEVTATDEAVFDVSVEAVTSGDAVDFDAGRSFDSVNSVEVDPPGTAGYIVTQDVTLTNKDSVAAGDHVTFHIRRDCDLAADTATDDAYILGIEIWEST